MREKFPFQHYYRVEYVKRRLFYKFIKGHANECL